jgi:Zn-dependent protease/CBS domain-containing protein
MKGLLLARVLGIRLEADWTVLVVLALVITNLGGVALPAWHADWSPLMLWGTAVAAGLLFLVSILLHELAHALVGRAYGVPVRRITLFIFGGVTDIEREPPSPRAELWMAAVGPAVSLAIGFLCTWVAVALSPGHIDGSAGRLLHDLGPVGTLLAWLGPLNLMLGVFNMVPGFPLDGGRVLRAAVWGITGDLERATRAAARGGQAVGFLLIAVGVLMAFGVSMPFFGAGLVSGIWLILIGWFLNGAAVASYQSLVAKGRLSDVDVGGLMRRELRAVAPTQALSELIEDFLKRGDGAGGWPVVVGERLVGFVSLSDVRRVPRSAWATTLINQVMIRPPRLTTVSPSDDAYHALRALAEHNLSQLPVVEGDRLVGLVHRDDLARWLAAHGAQRPSESPARPTRPPEREPPRPQP